MPRTHSLLLLVPLAMCKYHYRASEIRTASDFALSSKSLESTLTLGRAPRATVNDVVSKNITMVLENLLMNYENSQLPTHGKGNNFARSQLTERYSLNVFFILRKEVCAHTYIISDINKETTSKFGKCSRYSVRVTILCDFSGVPTVVKTNILIRSMGPVSELDMVRLKNIIRKNANAPENNYLLSFSIASRIRRYKCIFFISIYKA